jgi:uncharacterized protein involved in cysteine biosynthesis
MDVRTTVLTIVSVTVGIILVGSLLIPQASLVIADLTAEHPEWASLVSLTVTITIIGIVVAALYMYTSSR